MHSFDLSPKEAVALQRKLACELSFPPLEKEITLVAGADASYSKKEKRAHAAIVVMKIPEMEVVEAVTAEGPCSFPYIPGLLSFREIPILLDAFAKLKTIPEAIICDGQGIAHPRGIGLASHLGLILGIPTVGCAKTLLCGEHAPLPPTRFAESPLIYNERRVGTAFRSRQGVRPIYISPGHLIDIEGSVSLVRSCLTRYRLPEATRLADQLASHPERFVHV